MNVFRDSECYNVTIIHISLFALPLRLISMTGFQGDNIFKWYSKSSNAFSERLSEIISGRNLLDSFIYIQLMATHGYTNKYSFWISFEFIFVNKNKGYLHNTYED